jgi:hypothetical protein
MATDLNQLLTTIAGLTGADKSSQDYAAQNQQIQGNDQTLQINRLKMAAAQQAQADEQQYSQDVGAWTAAGSPPDGLWKLAMRYPDKAKSIVDANKMKDDAQQQADFHTGAQIYSAVTSNNPELVKQQITARRDAEKQAGIPTDDLDTLLAEFDTDPKSAMGLAKNTALAVMYGNNPELYAKAFNIGQDDGKPIAVSEGGGLYDPHTKTWLQRPGGKIERVVVTNPDGSTETQFRQIGGGSDSGVSASGIPRSVRNNNPGNIEDGAFAQSQPGYVASDGRFAQFASPEAGAAAQTALLSQYGAQGRNTVAKIVSKWAPASDGNPVGAYVKSVAQKMGVHPNQTLDMTDPQVLSSLQSAMAAFEGGSQSKSNAPSDASRGGRIVDSITTKPPGTSAILDDDTVSTMAEQYLAGDKTVLQGLGRGVQGSGNVVKLRAAITQQAKAQGMTGRDIAAQMADFTGILAGERAAGTRTANIELAATEADKVIPLARAASAAISRTGFVPLTRAIQAVQSGSNNVALRKLVTANNAVINTYARAISPTGAPHVADQEHARAMLSTAYDDASYNGVLDQMQQEIHAARSSPGEVRRSLRGAVGGGAIAPAAPAAAATPAAPIPPGAVYLGTHQGRPVYRVNGKNWTP